jgi:hypothetical protein
MRFLSVQEYRPGLAEAQHPVGEEGRAVRRRQDRPALNHDVAMRRLTPYECPGEEATAKGPGALDLPGRRRLGPSPDREYRAWLPTAHPDDGHRGGGAGGRAGADRIHHRGPRSSVARHRTATPWSRGLAVARISSQGIYPARPGRSSGWIKPPSPQRHLPRTLRTDPDPREAEHARARHPGRLHDVVRVRRPRRRTSSRRATCHDQRDERYRAQGACCALDR